MLLRTPKKSLVLLGLLLRSQVQQGEQSYAANFNSLLPQIAGVAAKEESIACESDDVCKQLDEYYICLADLEEDESGNTKLCVHKPLFPLTAKEWIGTFVFSVIMMLSNVAGIGGGGVAVPLAMFFFNLSMKPAIAISSFSIMFSTVTRFLYNFNERHPEKPGSTVIDYSMTNVMMPLTMFGSLVGAYIYISFPDLILNVILTLLLMLLTYKSGQKLIEIYRKESIEIAQRKAQQEE